jgi:hypothetical protein
MMRSFSVKDGKLCLDGGNGWLRTNQTVSATSR